MHTGSPDFTGEEEAKVLFPEESRQIVEEEYTPKVENAFCLFGRTNETHIVVEETLYVQDPISQSEKSIKYICKDEVLEELDNMISDPGYKFIGNIHTHPSDADDYREPMLSRRDIHTMGATMPFQRVWGVANYHGVNFFSHTQLNEPLDKTVKPEREIKK